MSRLSDAESSLHAQRYGATVGRAMRNALAKAPPPKFRIKVEIHGQFPGSPTCSQVHADALDSALILAVESRLDSLLADAMEVLALREARAADDLLRLAFAAATRAPAAGDPQ